jgi:hypothetical protein
MLPFSLQLENANPVFAVAFTVTCAPFAKVPPPEVEPDVDGLADVDTFHVTTDTPNVAVTVSA